MRAKDYQFIIPQTIFKYYGTPSTPAHGSVTIGYGGLNWRGWDEGEKGIVSYLLLSYPCSRILTSPLSVTLKSPSSVSLRIKLATPHRSTSQSVYLSGVSNSKSRNQNIFPSSLFIRSFNFAVLPRSGIPNIAYAKSLPHNIRYRNKSSSNINIKLFHCFWEKNTHKWSKDN